MEWQTSRYLFNFASAEDWIISDIISHKKEQTGGRMPKQNLLGGILGIVSVSIAGLLVLCACSSQLETVTSTVTDTALITPTTTGTVIGVGTTPPDTLIYPVPISRDQAFAIAKQNVPASVLYAKNILTLFSTSPPNSHGVWGTFFVGLNITEVGGTGPYSWIWVKVDAQTGEVISRIAFK
jgi:hypothetical protein